MLGDLDMARAGLIPAYAGSTRIVYPLSVCDRAHPRLRGEHPSDAPTIHLS